MDNIMAMAKSKKPEKHYKQGSNYLFKSDPQKFSD